MFITVHKTDTMHLHPEGLYVVELRNTYTNCSRTLYLTDAYMERGINANPFRFFLELPDIAGGQYEYQVKPKGMECVIASGTFYKPKKKSQYKTYNAYGSKKGYGSYYC